MMKMELKWNQETSGSTNKDTVLPFHMEATAFAMKVVWAFTTSRSIKAKIVSRKYPSPERE